MRERGGGRVVGVVAEEEYAVVALLDPREAQAAARAEHKRTPLVKQAVIQIDAGAVAVPDRDGRGAAVEQRLGCGSGLAASLRAGKGVILPVAQALPVIADHAGDALQIDADIKFLTRNAHHFVPFRFVVFTVYMYI